MELRKQDQSKVMKITQWNKVYAVLVLVPLNRHRLRNLTPGIRLLRNTTGDNSLFKNFMFRGKTALET